MVYAEFLSDELLPVAYVYGLRYVIMSGDYVVWLSLSFAQALACLRRTIWAQHGMGTLLPGNWSGPCRQE